MIVDEKSSLGKHSSEYKHGISVKELSIVEDVSRLWLSIHNSGSPVRDWSIQDLRNLVNNSNSSICLIAFIEDKPAGTGLAVSPRDYTEPDVGLVWISVSPDKRKHGIGTCLFQTILHWALSQGISWLETWVEESDLDSIAFALNRNFEKIRRETRWIFKLRNTDLSTATLPPDIEIISLARDPTLTRDIYEIAMTGFQRDQMPKENFNDWVTHHLGEKCWPEACFIARNSDEIIGFTKLHISDQRPNVASHNGTCVKPTWRGRGIAYALKCAQLDWAQKAGFERLEARNEQHNLPKIKLYKSLGYKEIDGSLIMRSPIDKYARMI